MSKGSEYVIKNETSLSKMIGFVWLLKSLIPLVYIIIFGYAAITDNTTGMFIGTLLIILLTVIYFPTCNEIFERC